jgi:uncharacterized protein YbjQ (UPF0145 family)
MKFSCLTASVFLIVLSLSLTIPRAWADTNDGTPAAGAVSDSDIQMDVQVTELGMMRALLVLDSKAIDSENVITQRLSDSDFRVFPSATEAGSSVSMDEMKDLGQKNKADLVFYATVSTRLKNKLGDFQLYEGEATVQVYSPVTGEMMVTKTVRADGDRNVDDVEAERSAREKVLDEATKEVVVRMLDKAQKMLVHEAVINGVYNYNQLLAIMEYMGKMEGVYGVREVSYDRDNKVGVIDIIGSPRSETYWRAYLEKMPKAKVIKLIVITNPEIRKKYPSWFNE